MQHDLGYFEEGQLDKRRDLRLLGRLIPFLKPYRPMLSASIGLVITEYGDWPSEWPLIRNTFAVSMACLYPQNRAIR